MPACQTTPDLDRLDRQIIETIARERRERQERLEKDALRYHMLKGAGARDHAAIRADADANGGDFDAALDRYVANLTRLYFESLRKE